MVTVRTLVNHAFATKSDSFGDDVHISRVLLDEVRDVKPVFSSLEVNLRSAIFGGSCDCRGQTLYVECPAGTDLTYAKRILDGIHNVRTYSMKQSCYRRIRSIMPDKIKVLYIMVDEWRSDSGEFVPILSIDEYVVPEFDPMLFQEKHIGILSFHQSNFIMAIGEIDYDRLWIQNVDRTPTSITEFRRRITDDFAEIRFRTTKPIYF